MAILMENQRNELAAVFAALAEIVTQFKRFR
jgi:hypothetical protein